MKEAIVSLAWSVFDITIYLLPDLIRDNIESKISDSNKCQKGPMEAACDGRENVSLLWVKHYFRSSYCSPVKRNEISSIRSKASSLQVSLYKSHAFII